MLIGTDTRYTVTVRNSGPSDATNVRIVDTLPVAGLANARLVSPPNGGSCVVNSAGATPGGNVTCTVPHLAARESVTFTIDMQAVARGRHTNDVSVTSDETVPGYEATIWLGIMAPKGTPKEVVTFLNNAINKVIEKPEVKEAWLKQGAIPMVMTPAEFDAYLRKDIEKWANVVKVSGASVR